MGKISNMDIGIAILMIVIVMVVGVLVYLEQVEGIESWMDEHPGEDLEIGGPPVIDNLGLLVIVVGSIMIFCTVALYFAKEEDNNVV